MQSELPWPIQRNSVETDHGCMSKLFFDKVGDNVTLTLYNVTMTSQKPFNSITSVIEAKQTAKMKLMFFSIKYSDILLKKTSFIYSADLTFE